MVVGLDPSTPAGVAFARVHADPDLLRARVGALAVLFDQLRESVARVAPAVQREMSRVSGNVRTDPPMPEYDAGDGMHWSPPADGEETPPCPA